MIQPANKFLYYLPLIISCAAAFLLAAPTAGNNIDRPNMIVYFNADEGGLMDLAWYYYSGEKRSSFQWEFNYGLEMVYLADIARLLKPLVRFTPGTFVLILRWFHIFAWIGSLIALWFLIARHFGGWWKQACAVWLLATRHAFGYCLGNLKPEPLVLLLIIIGLDYSLRIVDRPSWKNLCIAAACASCAFVTKFAGLFLLPAITFAVYFSQKRARFSDGDVVFPVFKLFWALPALLAIPMIAGPIAVVMLYKRISTGTTWFQECGLWLSLAQNKAGLILFIAGAFCIFASLVLWALVFFRVPAAKKMADMARDICSYALITLGVFAGFTLFFGFGWLVNPGYFITTYAFLGTSGPVSASTLAIFEKGLLYAFIRNICMQTMDLDAIIAMFFAVYLGVEAYNYRKLAAAKSGRSSFFKRLVLVVFLMPAIGCLFSMMRLAQHHMLPFFAVMSVLALEGIDMGLSIFAKRPNRNIVMTIVCLLLAADIAFNGSSLVKSRIYAFRQKEDMAYEAARWFSANIPSDARIVSEHNVRVYIPDEYNNVRMLHWNGKDEAKQLRKLVDDYRPRYIYHGQAPEGGAGISDARGLLPDKNLKLVKVFDSADHIYMRFPGDKFYIYEVLD